MRKVRTLGFLVSAQDFGLYRRVTPEMTLTPWAYQCLGVLDLLLSPFLFISIAPG